MIKEELKKYTQLIEDFLSKKLNVDEFETKYLNMVKNETFSFGYDSNEFKIISKLFNDVDAYCGDPKIANYSKKTPILFRNIDEKELRKRAKKALDMLVKIINK